MTPAFIAARPAAELRNISLEQATPADLVEIISVDDSKGSITRQMAARELFRLLHAAQREAAAKDRATVALVELIRALREI